MYSVFFLEPFKQISDVHTFFLIHHIDKHPGGLVWTSNFNQFYTSRPVFCMDGQFSYRIPVHLGLSMFLVHSMVQNLSQLVRAPVRNHGTRHHQTLLPERGHFWAKVAASFGCQLVALSSGVTRGMSKSLHFVGPWQPSASVNSSSLNLKGFAPSSPVGAFGDGPPKIPGWWFGTCFIFPYIGNNQIIIPTDFHSIIFQRGRAKPPTRYPCWTCHVDCLRKR